MLYFWWGCRGNLNLIALRIERESFFKNRAPAHFANMNTSPLTPPPPPPPPTSPLLSFPASGSSVPQTDGGRDGAAKMDGQNSFDAVYVSYVTSTAGGWSGAWAGGSLDDKWASDRATSYRPREITTEPMRITRTRHVCKQTGMESPDTIMLQRVGAKSEAASSREHQTTTSH